MLQNKEGGRGWAEKLHDLFISHGNLFLYLCNPWTAPNELHPSPFTFTPGGNLAIRADWNFDLLLKSLFSHPLLSVLIAMQERRGGNGS